jgi:Fic family protein
MSWNWEQAKWPHFYYKVESLPALDRKFLQGAGGIVAVLNHFDEEAKKQFIVELLSVEGLKSASIEGEVLVRESLQSSIRRNFGLQIDQKKKSTDSEKGMADLMCNVYETYKKPLTHAMMYEWHDLLMHHRTNLESLGSYRTHHEPMQIVSRQYGDPTVYFEAPPSSIVKKEMSAFIDWYNSWDVKDSILGRASQVHVYFESIHPFEDGNGRIGRALVEKALSQYLGHPTLIAISQVIEARKKEYYFQLGQCNKTLNMTNWVSFFSEVILQAQENSIRLINFLVNKSKLMIAMADKLNERQEKALLRIFAEGIDGFAGGLSAENYISITKASRATATRDLADLIDKNALVKTGQLRHTRYWLPFINNEL